MVTNEDKHAALWAKLGEYSNERIDSCRRENDRHRSEVETSALRGRISELKRLREFLGMVTSPDHQTASLVPAEHLE